MITVLLGRPLFTYPLERIVSKPWHVPDNWLKGLCHGCSVHFVNKTYYASLLAINTTWEITCLWQNHSFVSNKCLLSIISHFTNNKSELWKTVRQTSHGFRNHKCNPFQSPSSLSMRVSFCISMLSIPCFRVLSGYFYVSLNLVAVPTA